MNDSPKLSNTDSEKDYVYDYLAFENKGTLFEDKIKTNKTFKTTNITKKRHSYLPSNSIKTTTKGDNQHKINLRNIYYF